MAVKQNKRAPERAGVERTADLVALPIAPSDDATLVEGLIARRPAAAAELFDRFEPMVRRTLVRMLGSNRDLDDLTQDVFVAIVRKCETLRDRDALKSFVVSVAVRTARAELRKRRLWRWVGLSGTVTPPVTLPHNAVMLQGLRRVYEILDSFDVDTRLAFVLRRVEGYELTETAKACGCSLATIKRKLARAEGLFDTIARRDPLLKTFLEEWGEVSS